MNEMRMLQKECMINEHHKDIEQLSGNKRNRYDRDNDDERRDVGT